MAVRLAVRRARAGAARRAPATGIPRAPADEQTSPAGRITGQQPGPDTRALAAAGRRVGLASVVLALCVPLIVPGLHPSKLFSTGPGIGGSGGTSAAIALPDTLSQTLRELQESHVTTVLTYTMAGPKAVLADPPPYLQTYVYDTLTSSGQVARRLLGERGAGQHDAVAPGPER